MVVHHLQIAKLALDLKKKFEYTSPAHTSSSAARSTASGSTRKAETAATASDMKSELFGGARNPVREQDNTERDLSAILRGEEPTEGGDVEEGESGEGEEEEEEGEGANAYGGMLT